MKKNIFISFLVVSCLVFSAAGALAQERESTLIFGNLAVTPGLTLQEVYDDNIYLGSGTNSTTESEESDWITHIIPSIMLDYSLHERGGIKLGYLGDYAYYKDDSSNDWKNHKGIFGLNYKAPVGLIVGIDNLYTRAQDPYGSDNEYSLGVPQTERWHNDLKTKIGYEFRNLFRIFAYYNYYKQKYKDKEIDYSQNYDCNEVGAGIEKKIFPLTWGFLRYFHGETDYYTHREGVTDSNDADFTYDNIKIGLAWDPGAKIKGELNFGYTWKKYNNNADVSGSQYCDSNTWIASTFLSYEPTATTTLGLAIMRAMRDAGADTTEYFDDTGISINLKQVILSELSLLVGAAYSKHDYKNSTNSGRKDDNYKARIGIEYLINEWLMAGADYTYREKDSSSGENDYKDNKFQVILGMTY